MITVTKGQWFPLTIGNISYAGAAFDLQGATEVSASLVSTLGVKSPLSFEITAYNEISAVCDGTLSAGKYGIEVSCKGADGKAYRMKSPGAIIEVSSSTTSSTGSTSVRVAGDEWELTADVEMHEGQARTYMSLLEEVRQGAVKATEEAKTAADVVNSTVDEVTKAVGDAKKAASGADKAKALSEEQTAKAEKTNSDITAAENARVMAESARTKSESARTEAEAARQEAEKKREDSEETRTRTETERETNEQTRQANETTRQAAEEKRESDTDTAIATMKSDTSAAVKTMQNTTAAAITSMDEHRSAFDDAEVTRVSNEQARQEAESERETQERARVKNEDGRVKGEEARANSEGARAQAEAARVQAEAARVQAEAARATAENEREQGYTEKTAHLEELLQYIKDNHLETDAKLAEAIKNTITGTDEFVYLDVNDGNVKSMPNTNQLGDNVAAVYYAGKRSLKPGTPYMLVGWGNNFVRSIDLSGWDFEAATNLTGFMRSAVKINTLTFPDNMKLACVIDMGYFLSEAYSLKSIDGTSNWTLESVMHMGYCFWRDSSLQSIDLGKCALENLTDVSYCFDGCENLREIDLSRCNINKCTSWEHWLPSWSNNLETLRIGLIDFSLCGDVDFSCGANIRELTGTLKGIKNNFTARSTRMTRDSCMVVINGLETVTEAKTLTLGANNKPVSLGGKGNDPILDDDLKIATDKGWTVQFA